MLVATTMAAAVGLAGVGTASAAPSPAAAPSTVSSASSVDTAATAVAAKAGQGARAKVQCRVGAAFRPRSGPGNKFLQAKGRGYCNQRVNKIKVTVKLIEKNGPTKKRVKIGGPTQSKTVKVNVGCQPVSKTYVVKAFAKIDVSKKTDRVIKKSRKLGPYTGRCR